MVNSPAPERPRALARILSWRRVRLTLGLAFAFGLLLSFNWGVPGIVRLMLLGLIALLVFGLFERWPKRLPKWLARWALQVVAVALAMPVSTAILSAMGATPHWPVQG